MWRTMAAALVATLVAFSFAGAAFAAHGAATVKGEVISVDPSAKILTIKPLGERRLLTFTVHERAAKALTNLKPGDKVEVSTHSFTVGAPESSEQWVPTAEVVEKR